MADELKIPAFSKQKKLKTVTVSTEDALPAVKNTVASPPSYVPLTDEQIESCRKGQDIFDFARDIEEIIRVNNKI